MNPLIYYQVVAVLLLGLGLYALVGRRTLVGMLIGVELMLNGAGLSIVAAAQLTPTDAVLGQLGALLVMGLAAADVAATLAPDYVGALAKPLGLVRRRILSPEVMRYVCLYSPARRATSPAAEGFSDHLIRILAKRK